MAVEQKPERNLHPYFLKLGIANSFSLCSAATQEFVVGKSVGVKTFEGASREEQLIFRNFSCIKRVLVENLENWPKVRNYQGIITSQILPIFQQGEPIRTTSNLRTFC